MRPFRWWPAAAVLLCLLITSSAAAAPRGEIIGGTSAAPGSYPFVVSVTALLDDGETQGCTGSVVAPRLVLTAAHCVTNGLSGAPLPAAQMLLRFGSRNRITSTRTVRQVIVEPGYDPVTHLHDTALLVLARRTPVAPVTLATETQYDVPATIVGWGETRYGGPPPRMLQQAVTEVLSDDQCQAAWSTVYDAADELCIAKPPAFSTGVCHGDSGGPLLVGGVQVAVATFVDGDCLDSIPDVYQSTAEFLPFLDAVRASLTPGSPAADRTRPGR